MLRSWKKSSGGECGTNRRADAGSGMGTGGSQSANANKNKNKKTHGDTGNNNTKFNNGKFFRSATSSSCGNNHNTSGKHKSPTKASNVKTTENATRVARQPKQSLPPAPLPPPNSLENFYPQSQRRPYSQPTLQQQRQPDNDTIADSSLYTSPSLATIQYTYNHYDRQQLQHHQHLQDPHSRRYRRHDNDDIYDRHGNTFLYGYDPSYASEESDFTADIKARLGAWQDSTVRQKDSSRGSSSHSMKGTMNNGKKTTTKNKERTAGQLESTPTTAATGSSKTDLSFLSSWSKKDPSLSSSWSSSSSSSNAKISHVENVLRTTTNINTGHQRTCDQKSRFLSSKDLEYSSPGMNAVNNKNENEEEKVVEEFSVSTSLQFGSIPEAISRTPMLIKITSPSYEHLDNLHGSCGSSRRDRRRRNYSQPVDVDVLDDQQEYRGQLWSPEPTPTKKDSSVRRKSDRKQLTANDCDASFSDILSRMEQESLADRLAVEPSHHRHSPTSLSLRIGIESAPATASKLNKEKVPSIKSWRLMPDAVKFKSPSCRTTAADKSNQSTSIAASTCTPTAGLSYLRAESFAGFMSTYEEHSFAARLEERTVVERHTNMDVDANRTDVSNHLIGQMIHTRDESDIVSVGTFDVGGNESFHPNASHDRQPQSELSMVSASSLSLSMQNEVCDGDASFAGLLSQTEAFSLAGKLDPDAEPVIGNLILVRGSTDDVSIGTFLDDGTPMTYLPRINAMFRSPVDQDDVDATHAHDLTCTVEDLEDYSAESPVVPQGTFPGEEKTLGAHQASDSYTQIGEQNDDDEVSYPPTDISVGSSVQPPTCARMNSSNCVHDSKPEVAVPEELVDSADSVAFQQQHSSEICGSTVSGNDDVSAADAAIGSQENFSFNYLLAKFQAQDVENLGPPEPRRLLGATGDHEVTHNSWLGTHNSQQKRTEEKANNPTAKRIMSTTRNVLSSAASQATKKWSGSPENTFADSENSGNDKTEIRVVNVPRCSEEYYRYFSETGKSLKKSYNVHHGPVDLDESVGSSSSDDRNGALCYSPSDDGSNGNVLILSPTVSSPLEYSVKDGDEVAQCFLDYDNKKNPKAQRLNNHETVQWICEDEAILGLSFDERLGPINALMADKIVLTEQRLAMHSERLKNCDGILKRDTDQRHANLNSNLHQGSVKHGTKTIVLRRRQQALEALSPPHSESLNPYSPSMKGTGRTRHIAERPETPTRKTKSSPSKYIASPLRWGIFAGPVRTKESVPRQEKIKSPSKKKQLSTQGVNVDLETFMSMSAKQREEISELSLKPIKNLDPHITNSALPQHSHIVELKHVDNIPRLPAMQHIDNERKKQIRADCENYRNDEVEREPILKIKHCEMQGQRHSKNVHPLDQKSLSIFSTKSDVSPHQSIVKTSTKDTESTNDSRGVFPGTCIICNENERTHMAQPCNHYYFCGPCSEKVQDRTCPICGDANISFARVYA